MSETTASPPYIVLTAEDMRVLGQEQFGAPGLTAIESVGPFVSVRSLGPLLAIHDSTIDPGLGIPHHPHRRNERIFFMESGELDHSDSRNDIAGHLEPGDVGLFTEGERGMVHSEWNHGDVPSRIYILVYRTDPIPDDTAFTVLADAETPRYEEAPGAQTREMVGPKSPLRVHGDIRSFTGTVLAAGSSVAINLADGECGVLAVREGTVSIDGHTLAAGATVLFPPSAGERAFDIRAGEPARILRTVTGPGEGLRRA